MEDTNYQAAFLAIGLDPKVVESITKNKKVSHRLKELLDIGGVKECSKAIGNLLYQTSTKMPESIHHHTKTLVDYVVSEQIVKPAQLDEAIKYLTDLVRTKGKEAVVDPETFKHEAGVGIVVTDDQITEFVDKLYEENKEEITSQGHDFEFNKLIYKARDDLKWADQKKVIELINKKKVDLLGDPPKTDGKKKKPKAAAPDVKKEEVKKEDAEHSHGTTGKNILELVGRDIAATQNSEELLKKHREATGGRIVTRFPPEPNGYLHIGHAKAMRFNFTVAAENGGYTYLRYDDTNPVKENQDFIDNIRYCVDWLGYNPWKVTFASDYFEELYELACELIRRGKAYVDHLTKVEINDQRQKKENSPYRNRTVEENLLLFKHMREGRFAENECCLRMKIDMTHENPNMRDPVAYRIRYVPHPHAGDKWCIYPTYDYTHCINDSLENITHSLCTLEFENRRESYYWLLEALDLFRPIVWEYSRLNLTYTVLSKRKLEKLVMTGKVDGWEDPRLLTVLGLKRRGYTPSMINDFCNEIGVSRRGNDNVTQINLLESYARRELDRDASRTFGVQEPVLLDIVNFDEVKEREFEAPLFPIDKSKGSQIYKLSKQVYIDKDDFSEVHAKGFYGLTPEQPVCLKYGPVVKLVEIVKAPNGEVDHVKVQVLTDFKEKLKGFIHWVSKDHSVDVIMRLYNYLFDCQIVKDEDWEQHINPNSLIIKKNAKVWSNIAEAKVYDRFQFERLAYFVVDRDSRTDAVGGKLVFNRIVELKESKEKAINLGK